MDTIEQTEPIGADDIASSTDTSANDTQPVETTDAIDADVEETGEAEVLLAGKYKTAEELEKAYGEIQKTNGQLSQKAELANLLEKQTGMNAQQIAEYIRQQEQVQLQQQMQNDPSFAMRQENENLKAQMALQSEQQQLNEFISKNPEYEPFKEDILDMGLNYKRDLSYEQIAEKFFGKAFATGQQKAYKKIENKTQTQSTGTKSAPQKAITAEDMKNMSVAELEAILPHSGILRY